MLDEAIFKKPAGEVKKENLYKTSAEMFSIYIFVKDPMMQVKSDKYTDGEFKKVKDLISLDDSLLVSSQMSNSLLMMQAQQKLIQKAQKESPFAAMAKTGDSAPKPFGGPAENAEKSEEKDQERDSPSEKEEKEEVAPPAPAKETKNAKKKNARKKGEKEDESLEDMNQQLHDLLGMKK